MNIVSSYVHALEGRLRIKVPELKGSSLKARDIEGHLGLCPGVEEVSANPVTGSVLVMYHPRLIGQDEIILALQRNRLPGRRRAESAAGHREKLQP